MNIKKGDTVKILKGKDNGKSGKVIKVFPETNKIMVEGINLFKKHIRPKRQGEKGDVIQVARPLNASNAAVLCSACSKATRIGYIKEGEKKVRVCKKCKTAII